MKIKLRTYPVKDNPPTIEFNLNKKNKKISNTKSFNKQAADAVIAGGYNKDSSQPNKKELNELEKNV